MKLKGQPVCGGPAHITELGAQEGIENEAGRGAAYHEDQSVQEKGQRYLKAVGADGLADSLIAATIQRPD